MNSDRMPDFDDQEDGQPTSAPGYGWDGDRLVPTVGFAYPRDDEPGQETRGPGESEMAHGLRIAILALLSGGRHGAYARIGGLAVISGLFEGPADAARALRVSRTTISRAVERLRSELRSARPESSENTNEINGFDAPQ